MSADLPRDPFVSDSTLITASGRLAVIQVTLREEQLDQYEEAQRRLTSIRRQLTEDYEIPVEPFEAFASEILNRSADESAPGSAGASAWLAWWAERREIVRASAEKLSALVLAAPAIRDSSNCLILARNQAQVEDCHQALQRAGLSSRVTIAPSQTSVGSIIIGSPSSLDLADHDPDLLVIVDPMSWAEELDSYVAKLGTTRDDGGFRRVLMLVCRVNSADALEEGVDPILMKLTPFLPVCEKFTPSEPAGVIRRFCAPYPEGFDLIEESDKEWPVLLFAQEIKALLLEYQVDFDEFIKRTSQRMGRPETSPPAWYRSTGAWMPHYFQHFIMVLNEEQFHQAVQGIGGTMSVSPSELRNVAFEWVRRWVALLNLGLECRRINVPQDWIAIAEGLADLCEEIIVQGHESLLQFANSIEAQVSELRSGRRQDVEVALLPIPTQPPGELVRKTRNDAQTAAALGLIEPLGPALDPEPHGKIPSGPGEMILDLEGLELSTALSYSMDQGRYDGSSTLLFRDAVVNAYAPHDDLFALYRQPVFLPKTPLNVDPAIWIDRNAARLQRIFDDIQRLREETDLRMLFGIGAPKPDRKGLSRLAGDIGNLYGRLLAWIIGTRQASSEELWQQVIWAQADLGTDTVNILRSTLVELRFTAEAEVGRFQLGRTEYIDVVYGLAVELDSDKQERFHQLLTAASAGDM